MRFPKNIPPRYWVILVSSILIFVFSYFRFLNNFELITYDLRFKLRPSIKTSPDILIIEISDDTLKNLGHWPLPRDFHASLVDVLKELGARTVVFDILFSEPTLYDETLAQAVKRAAHVYLPIVFYIDDKQTHIYPFVRSCNILAGIVDGLQRNAAGIGHINVFIDSDGKARRIPLFIEYNQTLFPQLGFKAACDWLGLNLANIKVKGNRVIVDDRLSLPVLYDGSFMVNYPDMWQESFRHLSYFEILKSYSQMKQGQSPALDLSLFKDKICFVGLTATGTSDLRPNPLENIYPMLGLQASVSNSVIQRSFITDVGLLFNALINILIFILSMGISLRFRPIKALLGSATIGLFYFGIATALFIFEGIWIDLFFPLSLIILAYIGSMAWRFFDEVKKRQILEKELDIARTIQKCFLPEDIKEFYGLSLSSFIQPAKFVAGDLYDILLIDEKRIGVFIGDVSGKGVSASLIMAQTISLFRIFARQFLDCSQVLTLLNKELYGRFSGRFVTCLYMIVNTARQNVRVCSAGHAPVLLYKKEANTISEVELSQELPLGVTEDVEYPEVAFDIRMGDKIIVFTDGLHEARNKANQEFGLERIKKIVLENGQGSCEQLSEAIKAEVLKFSSGRTQHDDITFIASTL